MRTMPKTTILQQLGLSDFPTILAPLAGVSDHPFRRVCAAQGAELTYVEMISATALIYNSKKTLAMLKRHPEEKILGVQITGRSAEETAEAIRILEQMPFDTIDINMGCPVTKVVKNGCGSAILKDPKRVYETVRLARAATRKPLSVKIRIGWDRNSLNGETVARAAADGGADWLTVHGRTRNDDYGTPIDLPAIAAIKQAVSIPVIGNGNIFSEHDRAWMRQYSGVDGVMVSRGALGDPWLFRRLAGDQAPVTLGEWLDVVMAHLRWQHQEYGDQGYGAVMMRKHLLWYAKGWPGVKNLREQITQADDIANAARLIEDFAASIRAAGVNERDADIYESRTQQRFAWDPKFDMDRRLDRGVGDDGLIMSV